MENKELIGRKCRYHIKWKFKNESLKAVENLNVKAKNIENIGTIGR